MHNLQLYCLSHNCIFLTNVATFKKGNNRFLRVIAQKHNNKIMSNTNIFMVNMFFIFIWLFIAFTFDSISKYLLQDSFSCIFSVASLFALSILSPLFMCCLTYLYIGFCFSFLNYFCDFPTSYKKHIYKVFALKPQPLLCLAAGDVKHKPTVCALNINVSINLSLLYKLNSIILLKSVQ